NYTLQLERVRSATYETEPNDTAAMANPWPTGNNSAHVAGVIGTMDDVDTFSFPAYTGQVFTFSIYAHTVRSGNRSNGFFPFSGFGSSLQPDLSILNGSGTTLGTTLYAGTNITGESITNGLAAAEITFVAPSMGTYYVQVSNSQTTFGANHYYVLEKR